MGRPARAASYCFGKKEPSAGTSCLFSKRLRVKFLVSHGFASATAAYNLAQTSLEHDRPTRVIYVGDFDPSGLHMSEVDLPQRLERYGGNVQITRIAITEDDVLRSGLPDFPASDKIKDVRYRWFTENHGTRCIEVDAMPPPELREACPQGDPCSYRWRCMGSVPGD